jgi:hypothetical protein
MSAFHPLRTLRPLGTLLKTAEWSAMTRDLMFLGGFVLILLGFLFVLPSYIALNAAVTTRIPSWRIPLRPAMRDRRRYYIAAASLAVFVIVFFGLALPATALILGFLVGLPLVVLDYINIYREARTLERTNALGESRTA